jgi:two-component system, OmpR family, phosphate regulon sensor histidine kinase PhoR
MSEQDELRELNYKLQRLERDRAQLARELAQVKRERMEYLQNVSHQLVAPLNAIKWHIENLNAGRIDLERAKKVLRSIYSQSTIAVHLAKNFALMSNLEADHALNALKEPLQEVSLCQLLVNLADDFQPLGWDKGIDISVEENPLEKSPNVLVMKPLISQVFSNIIENAVKYSNKNTEIVIDGEYQREIDSVAINVRNRGISLPEDIAHVFERGFRSPEAKNRYPAGTGYGMYIANRIVEIHEGDIEANTDEKGRTTFTVTLSVSGLKGKARIRAPKDNTIG